MEGKAGNAPRGWDRFCSFLYRLPLFGWVRGTDEFLIMGQLRD
jgi:hypothetical protein